jgi:hypothetical protein
MRPKASDIVKRLYDLQIGPEVSPLIADWSDEFTSKFRRSQQADPLLPTVAQIERMLFGDSKFMLQVN